MKSKSRLIINLLFVLSIVLIGLGCERNHPPDIPVLIYPGPGPDSVEIPVTLRWSCHDPDGDSLLYSVRLTSTEESQEFQTSKTYLELVNLQPKQGYSWSITAKDREFTTKSKENTFYTRLYNPPGVSTDSILFLSDRSLHLWGHLLNIGVMEPSSCGFICDYITYGDINSSQYSKVYSTWSQSGKLDFLTEPIPPKTNVLVKAFATFKDTTRYGQILSTWSPPKVITKSIVLEGEHLICSGNVIYSHWTLLRIGFCIATSSLPDISRDYCVEGYNSPIEFRSQIGNLSPDSAYYARAFATTETGTYYGDVIAVECPTCCQFKAVTVDVETGSPYNIRLIGNIKSACDPQGLRRGFQVSKNPDLVNGEMYWTKGGTGEFDFVVVNLEPETEYFFATKATMGSESASGQVLSFRTPEDSLLKTLKIKTKGVESIGPYSGKLLGEFDTGGINWNSETGFFIGTDPDLVNTGTYISASKGPGTFEAVAGYLEAEKKYFFAACTFYRNKPHLGSILNFSTVEDTITSFMVGAKRDPVEIHFYDPPVILDDPSPHYLTLAMDLDQDGVTDVKLLSDHHYSPGGYDSQSSSISIYNDSLQISTIDGKPNRSDFGEIKENLKVWSNGGYYFQFSQNGNKSNENWYQTGFVVFRILTNGKYRYGWIKISIVNVTKVTIYEYALERVGS